MTPGARLGDYEILSKLGQGSMGEVYRAKDLKLGRIVAIKVLPEHFAADTERLHRFEQEARAASALNHPNIVTIHDVGEHEGAPYIVMEYVEGVTLFAAIEHGLDDVKFLRYFAQIAEGLAKAHRAGIVHRDLKPENIVISEDDYVKILDFGLAKLIPPGEPDPDASTLMRDTMPGTVVGTPGYLAPEQAKGQSADFRSDQFSLGAIAYEMATGKRIFERDSAAQTLAAIIEHGPEPVASLNPRVPGRVAAVIDRCLSKDPEKRYASTGDLAKIIHASARSTPAENPRRFPAAIGAAGGLTIVLIIVFGPMVSDWRESTDGGVEAPRIESIAVLPLENLSADPEQEYFADGMTEALIADLAKISALRVISRRSVMRFKGSDEPLPDIARTLGVDAIVAGTVLRVDDEVRITAQLIRGSDDDHLWTDSYDRDVGNVLSLLSDVAQVIADEIEVAITPEQRAQLAATTEVDPEVQELYLKARFFLNRPNADSLELSRSLFEQTIHLDEAFAPGYAGLALAEFLSGFLGDEDGAPQRATKAARRALELDASLAEAYSALGLVQLYYEWNWTDAEDVLRRAVALDPHDSSGRHGLADYLLTTGDVEESLRQVEVARRFDPMSPLTIAPVVGHLILARRYDQAILEGEAMLVLFPDFPIHGLLAIAHWHRGSIEKALDEYQLAWGETSPIANAMMRAYRDDGPDAAMLAVADLIAVRATNSRGSALAVASFYATAGEADSAFVWLERALDERIPQLLHINADPHFDVIRSDERFKRVLERMNFGS